MECCVGDLVEGRRKIMLQGTREVIFCLAVAFVLLADPSVASAKASVPTHTRALPDGATYLIDVPANWTGTLFLCD